MDAKKVDVIIPIYNKETFIERLVKRLIKLPVGFFNIILVDDGSSDNSLMLINKYINYLNINNFYCYSKSNGGVSSARNFGIKNSVSEYIWFFDPDDDLDDDIFLNIEKIMQVEGDIVVFRYNLNYFESGKKIFVDFKKYGLVDKKEYLVENDALLEKSIDMNILWNKWYHKDIFKCIKFDEEISLGEDRCFNLDVFNNDGQASIINICIYNYYYYSEGTLSTSLNKKKVQDVYKTNVKNMEFYNFGREIFKAHLINQIHLRVLIREKNLLVFYFNEHTKYKKNFFPLYSLKEFFLLIFLIFKLDFVFNFFRELCLKGKLK